MFSLLFNMVMKVTLVHPCESYCLLNLDKLNVVLFNSFSFAVKITETVSCGYIYFLKSKYLSNKKMTGLFILNDAFFFQDSRCYINFTVVYTTTWLWVVHARLLIISFLKFKYIFVMGVGDLLIVRCLNRELYLKWYFLPS